MRFKTPTTELKLHEMKTELKKKKHRQIFEVNLKF